MKMFFVAGITIAVFLEFLLISKKNKSESDNILTLWMFLILIHLFLYYIRFTGDVFEFPFLLGIEQPLPLIHGVFLYFYVGALTRQLPGNKKLLILHFLPLSVTYAYLVTFFILPAYQKIQIYRNHGVGYDWFIMVKWYAMACSGLFYVVWSLLMLRRHENNIRDQFSDIENVNLLWLRILTFGLGGIWLLVVLFRNDALTYSGVVVFVFLIGFFGIRQADIFGQSPSKSDGTEKGKYQKSGLTEELSADLHRELKRRMIEEELYKKSNLSVMELSTKLGVHPNYLSQIINQIEKKNFYDFVNTFRLEEFKRLIAIPKNQHLTLLSVAHECGFNSKASFNRFFKKATGQTPSQYFTSLTSQ